MTMPTRPRDLAQRDYIGAWCVSSVALSVEHHGGMWYETYIFPAADGAITDWLEVWGQRYATRDAAIAGHDRVCARLRNGWDPTGDDAA